MAFEFLKGVFSKGRNHGSDLLLPAEQFKTLILHECARCDRNAHAFSLIHIDLRRNGSERGRDRSQTVRGLARTLVKRMRSTDEVGWLDGHSIGVFLPETDTKGARSLARDVCEELTYQIYTYPWISDLGGDGDDRGSRRRGREEAEPDNSSSGNFHREQQLTLHSEGITWERTGGEGNHQKMPQSARSIEEMILPSRSPFWKRAYDIFGSTVLLIAFSPLMIAVAAFIKIVSPGPVFFRQERIGYLGKPFTMIKFRTMKMSSDNISVHRQYLKDLINSEGKSMKKLDTDADNRLIPLAGILRRSCIDELPQLFNVFKGEMSLVGPRPCLQYEAEEFKLWQQRRFHAIPGMTGLWQVSGKNRLTFQEMMRLDIRYANRKNASMDLMISFKTLPAILGQIKDALAGKVGFRVREGRTHLFRKWSLNHLIRQIFL